MEFLKGIRIYNYRSIDSEGVELDDFGKVNIFIGKNNSGKSNILRFIAYLSQLINSDFGKKTTALNQYVYNFYNYENSIMFRFDIRYSSSFLDSYIKSWSTKDINRLSFKDTTKGVWVQYEYDTQNYYSVNLQNLGEQIIQNNLITDNTTAEQGNNFVNGLPFDSKNYISLVHKTYLIENYRKIQNIKTNSSTDNSVEHRSEIFNGIH